jgi:hypothetical protein
MKIGATSLAQSSNTKKLIQQTRLFPMAYCLQDFATIAHAERFEIRERWNRTGSNIHIDYHLKHILSRAASGTPIAAINTSGMAAAI